MPTGTATKKRMLNADGATGRRRRPAAGRRRCRHGGEAPPPGHPGEAHRKLIWISANSDICYLCSILMRACGPRSECCFLLLSLVQS